MQLEETCSICNGTGFVIKVVDGVDFAELCECYGKKLRDNRLKFANIPEAFKDHRLNSFVASYYRDKETLNNMVATVKYWFEHLEEAKAKGIGLYFYSNTKGSGKTRMATSIANELIYKYDMNVRFVTSLDIISEIRATWDRDTEFKSENQLLEYLKNTQVLVIDDFGTEVHKDWIDDKFYQIINTRYINKKLTIFTSNYALKELKYDERIISRITEMAYEVHFPEESIRDYIASVRQEQLQNSGGTK